MENSEKHPLQIVLQNLEYDCFKYSGRGMMNSECLAITTLESIGEFFSSFLGVLDLPQNENFYSSGAFEKIQDSFRSMKLDSLGHKKVIYFPTVEFIE